MLRNDWRYVPARRQLFQAKLGMYLFLAGLVFVFFSALLIYAVVRSAAVGPFSAELKVPSELVASTVALIGVSVAMHRAVQNVHHERIVAFQNWLVIGTLLGITFFVCQISGMSRLLEQHFAVADGGNRVFGIAFVLAMLHAVHVVAGFGILGYVLVRGLRGRYDHECHWPVDICATYWHFLDAVWVVMLLTFFVVR